MGIEVTHRKDNLFQKEALLVSERDDPNSYVAIYTMPIRAAVVKFLDFKLIGKTFPDSDDVEKIIGMWRYYMKRKTKIKDKEILEKFGNMYIANGNLCIANGGMGGNLVVGHIKTV